VVESLLREKRPLPSRHHDDEHIDDEDRQEEMF
jgi:hypothetical protein